MVLVNLYWTCSRIDVLCNNIYQWLVESRISVEHALETISQPAQSDDHLFLILVVHPTDSNILYLPRYLRIEPYTNSLI